jgi:hypothetical protein
MQLMLTPEGRLDKSIVESKILPLWTNSWMYKDNLYLKLNSILRYVDLVFQDQISLKFI